MPTGIVVSHFPLDKLFQAYSSFHQQNTTLEIQSGAIQNLASRLGSARRAGSTPRLSMLDNTVLGTCNPGPPILFTYVLSSCYLEISRNIFKKTRNREKRGGFFALHVRVSYNETTFLMWHMDNIIIFRIFSKVII